MLSHSKTLHQAHSQVGTSTPCQNIKERGKAEKREDSLTYLVGVQETQTNEAIEGWSHDLERVIGG